MRILIISESPYLLTRNGKISQNLMLHLTKCGHSVEGLVWHHDVSYFLPTETNKHFFKNIPLHPFLGSKGELPSFAFETMKIVQPNVIITIGDYTETDWVWAIKSLYPNLFKWVAIIPSGAEVINENSIIPLSYADHIVSTTRVFKEALNVVKTTSEQIPFGPDTEAFYPIERKPKGFRLLNMGKNSQLSNVPAFMKAVKMTGFDATLHTNLDDAGDYDIRGLVKRYQLCDLLHTPAKYLSVREGLSESLVNELYNSHDVVIDCSLQSQTALTTLEAMSTGCIPIGMSFGAMGEIFEKLPKEFRFSVPFETFLGQREEELAVISIKELVNSIENIHRSYVSDSGWVDEARKAMIDTARIFSKEKFVSRVNEIVEKVVTCDNYVAVDSF
jgi:glycosyltransferase involved in cell wall biosynthesis